MGTRNGKVAVSLAIVATLCFGGAVGASAATDLRAAASTVVPVSAIRNAMFKDATARIRGSATIDGFAGKVTLSGTARFTTGREDVTGRSGSSTGEDRVIGRNVYVRFDRQPWCRSTTAVYTALTVNQVVFSIKPSNAKPVRIGSATIANKSTTHYRLSPKNGETVNYWIDRKDRIVRMKWDSDESEHDTMNFYDYATSIPRIIAPANAPRC